MIFLWIGIGVLFLLLLFVAIVTVYLYRYGLSRRPLKRFPESRDIWSTPPQPRTDRKGNLYDPYGWGEEIRRADAELYALGHAAERITVQSRDGLTLAARYLPPEGEALRGIVLMVHGYRSSPMNDFSIGARDMRRMGMGCLLIEHRAHLTSEGDTIAFGVLERYDVLEWARLIEKEFPGVPVILDGISMGGATVLMAAGLPLPDNVRGIIADCPFTSMKEMFEKIIGEWFHLPAWPFIPLADLYCRKKNGFGFGDVTAQDGLLRAKVPVLMAHGTGDTFVPYEMSERIYRLAKDTVDVTLLTAEGAEHGLSYLCAYDAYHDAIRSFFDKCLLAKADGTKNGKKRNPLS